MFRICDNKGFHITLANGITISTQFGGGNYCSNYNDRIGENERGKTCDNAEVAIWDASGEWITKQVAAKARIESTDDVMGYVNISQWMQLLNAASNYEATT